MIVLTHYCFPLPSFVACLLLLSIGMAHPTKAQNVDSEYRWITGVSTILGKTKDFTPRFESFQKVYQPILLSTGEGSNTANSAFIAAYLGYRFNPKWVAGIALDYRYAKIFYEDFFVFGGQDTLDFTQKYSEYSIGIFSRYVLNPAQRLQFFIQPHIVVSSSRGEQFIGVAGASEYTSIPIRMQLKAGAQYRLSKHWYLWCLPVGIEYLFGRESLPGRTTKRSYSEFRMDISFARIQLGLEYRF